MQVRIQNQGSVPVPLTSTEGPGLAVQLEPGAIFELNDPTITVVMAGTNPSFTEDLKEALGAIWDKAMEIIQFWKDHPNPVTHGTAVEVRLFLDEVGGGGIKVHQGDDLSSQTEVAPGQVLAANGFDYIQLRELGLAQANINMQESP